MTTGNLVDRLAAHRTIGNAPRSELEWLAANGELKAYAAGETVSTHDQEVQGLYVILTGRVSFHEQRAGKRVTEWTAGDVTGVLPYSRVRKPPGDAIVDEAVEALALDRGRLPDLIRECPEITATLVHVMTDRARQFTASDLHDEKMVSLGTLSAGLAHELNNPASAANRCAQLLMEELTAAEAASRELGAAGLSSQQIAELDRILGTCVLSRTDVADSALDQSDREDAVIDWLSKRGIRHRAAESLAKTCVSTEVLERLARTVPPASLDCAVRWIASGAAARNLAMSIETATSRIHNLVSAIKGFTYMDRGASPEMVDIGKGLADTRAVVEGKAHQRSVQITLNVAPDLPRLFAFGGELNQIWEKLLENAIDAASKQVQISATREGQNIVVCVTDDGTGIPDQVKPRIFDPFFTTKPVGQGVGLGLDIARRLVRWHSGTIDFTSKPGCTVFRVTLPLETRGARRMTE